MPVNCELVRVGYFHLEFHTRYALREVDSSAEQM